MNETAPQQRMYTPEQAAAHFYNEALALAGRGDADSKNLAYRLLQSAVDVCPSFHPAWYTLGNANSDMKLGEGAVADYRRAIEIDPTNIRHWVNFGHQLYHLGRLEEAKSATEHALTINPDDPLALVNLSIIEGTTGELDLSLEHAQRAFEIDPLPIIEFTLAIALLKKRRWAEGLKHFESRFNYAARLHHMAKYPWPKWTGQDLRGKTLFLAADQGLGDTISMFRFFSMLNERAAGGKVIAYLQPDIMRLCAILFGASLKNMQIVPLQSTLPPADYWACVTGLAHALALNDEQIEAAQQPDVPALPVACPPTWKVPGRRLHIGVAWSGSKDNDIDRHRSFSPINLLELYRCPGIQLYGLQCGPDSVTAQSLGCGALIKDLSPFIRDVVDTLALMRELDLIVTVESSMGHMAALLGVDCIMPYSYLGHDWRIGFGDQGSLWAPNHRIVKQGPDATWTPVFVKIADMLKERIYGK